MTQQDYADLCAETATLARELAVQAELLARAGTGSTVDGAVAGGGTNGAGGQPVVGGGVSDHSTEGLSDQKLDVNTRRVE